jgi:hypothetical protein
MSSLILGSSWTVMRTSCPTIGSRGSAARVRRGRTTSMMICADSPMVCLRPSTSLSTDTHTGTMPGRPNTAVLRDCAPPRVS